MEIRFGAQTEIQQQLQKQIGSDAQLELIINETKMRCSTSKQKMTNPTCTKKTSIRLAAAKQPPTVQYTTVLLCVGQCLFRL